MEESKTKVCKDCKRNLDATTEYFAPMKKSKYGLTDVCINCLKQRKGCGGGSKWRKMGKNFFKP